MPSKSPDLLTPEQRAAFVRIPDDLADREIARYYTFTPDDLAVIKRRRRAANKLGFAVQLAVLRFPGRTITELPSIPARLLAYIAQQVGVDGAIFAHYGMRENTIYEHLDEIRAVFGFRNYDWRAMRQLMRHLLPLAMESDRPIPLIEAALDRLRSMKVIAPGMTTLEQLIVRTLRHGEQRVQQLLLQPLTAEHTAALDALLCAKTGRFRQSRITDLQWLRLSPGLPSAPQLEHILDRIAFLHRLQLPPIDARLHRNRVLLLARCCGRYGAQPLASFAAARKYTLLLPYLHELRHDGVDAALDMFDTVWMELCRKSEAKQEQHIAAHAHDLNTHVHILATVAEAFLHAEAEGLDPFQTVYRSVPKALVITTVQQARAIARPPTFDYLDLLESKYLPLRQALLQFYRTLPFQPFRRRDPAILALEHIIVLADRKQRVTTITATVGRKTIYAPLAHVNERWRPYVLSGTTINPNYYEAAAFEKLRAGLRSGDIAVTDSRRYQPFESYIIPKAQWAVHCAQGTTRLAETGDAHQYLAEAAARIQAQLAALHNELSPTSGLRLDAQGQFHLTPIEANVPEKAKALSRHLYRMLPRPDLPDLFREVNDWTNFLDQATHLNTEVPLLGSQAMPLLAATMATGMNLGLSAMAKAPSFTDRQLAWAADWYLRDSTLQAMLVTLDNFILHQALARFWGAGTASSSDGLRIRLGVKAPNAQRNREHFDDMRGLTLYLLLGDVPAPLRQQIISTNASEAWYTIDGLCNHETEFNIQEHSTDTGGSSEHVFGMCHFLGFRFAPRIAAPLDRHLWTIGQPADYGPLNTLLKGRVSTRLIVDHWEELKRLAGSIRHGVTPSSVLMRKLASYPRQNQLAQALAEVGKIEQTLHLLDCYRDEAVRRRIERRLDRHESANALGRAVFFGRRGVMRDRAFQDQMHRASCLVIVMAAIIAWNTVYLMDAISALRAKGEEVPDELLPHIAPLGWRHINLLGRYEFQGPSYSLDQRRPLRTEAAGELDVPLDDEPDTEAGAW